MNNYPYGNGGYVPNGIYSPTPYGVPMNPYSNNNIGSPNYSGQNSYANYQNQNNNNVSQGNNQQSPQFTPQVNTNKIYVTSVEDARNRQLMPNSDYIFLDNDKPLLYRKTVDATGKMDLETFEIIPYSEKAKEDASKDNAIDMSNFVSIDKYNDLLDKIDLLKDDLNRVKTYLKKKGEPKD